MRRVLILALVIASAFLRSWAVSFTDPGLVVLITDCSNKAQKVLTAQQAVMGSIATGHIWIRDELNETSNLQRQYNDYLDSFNSILAYVAQTYGLYCEIGRLTENFGGLARQLKKSPVNAIAVAITPKRNKIYRDLVLLSVDIINDIRQVCLSDIKMTEKERLEIVLGIRPKLRKMNRKLVHLTLAVKYTSMGDVWLELDNRARDPLDKNRIADAAMRRWRHSGRVVINPGDVIEPDPDVPDVPDVKPPIIPDIPDVIKPVNPTDSIDKDKPDGSDDWDFPNRPVDPPDLVLPNDSTDTSIKPVDPDEPLVPVRPSTGDLLKPKSKTTNFNTIR